MHHNDLVVLCTVLVFRQEFAFEDDIGSHACSLVHLKLLHACAQCHSSRVFTPLTSWHCKLGSNTEGTDGLTDNMDDVRLLSFFLTRVVLEAASGSHHFLGLKPSCVLIQWHASPCYVEVGGSARISVKFRHFSKAYIYYMPLRLCLEPTDVVKLFQRSKKKHSSACCILLPLRIR
jgi:hypothetical protein